MNEPFRPTPPEFLALARYWAEIRCHLWLSWLQPDLAGTTNNQIIEYATKRLGEIAAEVEEEGVAAIVAEVEDQHRQLVGDDHWHMLKEGTPEQCQALTKELAKRDPAAEARGKEDGSVEGVVIHHVTTGANTKGWIHTHGMDQLGLPELEMRNVPSYFIDAAARILREVCRYMKKPGVVVKVGEAMEISPKTVFRFVRAEPIPENQDHYEVERWQIVEMEPACEKCGCTEVSDGHECGVKP